MTATVAYECMACRTLRLSDDPVIDQQRLDCRPCGHSVRHRSLIRRDDGSLIYERVVWALERWLTANEETP